MKLGRAGHDAQHTPGERSGCPASALGTPGEMLGTPRNALGTPRKALSTPRKALGTPRHELANRPRSLVNLGLERETGPERGLAYSRASLRSCAMPAWLAPAMDSVP